VSWDHASDALERIAEATRRAQGQRCPECIKVEALGSSPMWVPSEDCDHAPSADELRRAGEDAWLCEQRELARIPSCPCDHPPGWHFSGVEALATLLVLAAIVAAAVLG
jgi:hypothetical protein